MIRKYKNDVRDIFFISVDKDIDNWLENDIRDDAGCYRKCYYNKNSKLAIEINIDKLFIINDDRSRLFILEYTYGPFITDFKVFMYVRKIKKYFKFREKNQKNETEINRIKDYMSKMENIYLKDIRKKKLNKIK